jgi:DNA primase large subunit
MSQKGQEREKNGARGGQETADTRSEDLKDSPMMARLLEALEAGTDVGHYGRLTFAMIARHFLKEDELVRLLAGQPDQDEERARAMLLQVKGRDYNPPKREKILQWQAQQEYQIIPDADDPDSGNVYRELKFPDPIYEHIQEYYEEKAEAQAA